jgi:PD-(D/E)XK nuclease superfamily protein
MLRIPTQLPDDLEVLIQRTIGCCITVHRALGPGLLETIYTRAMCIEFEAQEIAFETEKSFPVVYRARFCFRAFVSSWPKTALTILMLGLGLLPSLFELLEGQVFHRAS